MRALLLTVQAGPDKGRQIPLRDGPTTIGRGAGEDLQLSDGAVSRHHLSVQADSSGVRVIEVAGVNPVWTVEAGQRVAVRVGQVLGPGAALTVGATTLIVREVADAPVSSAPARGVELDATRVISGPPEASRLAALAALGDKLARCGSLAAVLRAATSWAVDALPAARSLVLSPDGSDVLSAASAGPLPDLALSSGLLARVLRERRAVLLHDVLAEPDLADRRSVQLRGITGAMAAPAEGLIFYAEWGPREAARAQHDDEALRLLVCAAQLISAIGDSARERQQLTAAVQVGGRPAGQMIGRSAGLQRLQVFLERVAATASTVLLFGESGTGKELAAGLIHALSPRASRPFVAINCAAIAEGLLESELFGHEKGAFTGAVAQHDGVFVRAHTGTLFMDEVGELSLAAQARMLRVLENRCLTRVGGSKELTVDVRLVAATHRDLKQRVAEGKFREDLLYRLSVLQTSIPPLRERRDDIPPLCQHFLRTIGESVGRRIEEVSPAAAEVLARHRWPGNVRELRNVIERALVLGSGPVLEVDDLPPELLHAAPVKPTEPGAVRPLVELEREAIVGALAATGGNKARASALLGIDRTTLYRKLKDHALG